MKRGSQTAALLLWALLLAFGGVRTAHAQGTTTAAVAGRVTNQEGAPVAGVRVAATNAATGVSSAVVTRTDGRFLIAGLQPGTYRLAASGLGYAAQTSADTRLVLGQTAEVNFTLAAQAVQIQGIQVSAQRNPTFSTSRTGAASVVTEETIDDLPTLSRNFTDVAALSPFVYVTGQAPSVAGSNNRMNNIQIDGAVNNDVFGLADSGVPGGQANAKPISLDAISQFQVLVAPFDVRQSGFAGGLINAVTKSGTNRFRGTAFGAYRNLDFIRQDLSVNVPGVVPLRSSLTAGDFENAQFGFSLGGPIIRDRLHFFTANEFEMRTIPEIFGIEADEATIRVSADSVNRFISLLEDYGVNPGIATRYSRENPNTNLFGRLDFQVNDNHRITLRHNFVRARDDDQASRGGATFELESATYDFKSITHSTVGQLHSQLGNSVFNELLVNFQTIRDRRSPAAEYLYPTLDVRTASIIGGTSVNSTMRAGAELFSHANELDQDIFQITNNLTATTGAHRLTLGGQVERYKFRNLFVPNALGSYSYGSLAAFEADSATTYSIAVPYPGVSDPAARFSVMQFSGYLQDEVTVNDALTLTLGVRMDVPRLLDEPIDNPDFLTAFGYRNSNVPETSFMFSPRLGFNWQAPEGPQMQIRGGVGLFTGRPPFVWLSNAYGNTGRNTVTLNCAAAIAPAFDPSQPAPTACTNGATATSAGTAIINTIDDDFRFPQELKVSLGMDRELPLGFTATIEGLFTKAVNQIFTTERNLKEGVLRNEPGIGTRLIYGTPVAQSSVGFLPSRISGPAFAQVVHAQNTSEPYSYMVSLELQRRFFELWNVRASYAHMRSFDIQSQTSSQATSNLGFNPIDRDINDPELRPSNFDRPHKVVLSVQSDALFQQLGGTELSVFYLGQSGKPYAYVYDGDVNGDGYETGGTVSNRNNDLLYVPNFAGEIAFQNADQQRLFEELVSLEECLQDQRGQVMERNSCRAPWTNQVDLKIRQGLPFRAGRNLKLELDIFNLGNLINEDWGLQRGPAFNGVDLLFLRGRRGNNVNNPLEFSYDGFTERDANNVLRATKPYDTFFASRYTIRIGGRLEF